MRTSIANPPPAPRAASRLARWACVAVGLLCVGLAALGAILPLLPATPFLLLASGCFVRSSPWLSRWLLASPLLGPILRDWQRRRGVTRRVKLTACVVVVAGIATTLATANFTPALQAMTCALGGAGIVVVARLPRITDDGETRQFAAAEA